MGFISTKMDQFMRANGKMTRSTESVSRSSEMVICTKDSGTWDPCMALAL